MVLFDEPLSNLDAKLREQMRVELVRLQREVGITSIYVTHDQSEALVMSDRVVVMDKGVIQQIGDPHDDLRAPSQRIRGEFHRRRQPDARHARRPQRRALRDGNPARRGPRAAAPAGARRQRRDEGQPLILSVRPEDISVHLQRRTHAHGNLFEGEVIDTVYLGNFLECRVQVGPLRDRASRSTTTSSSPRDRKCFSFQPDHGLCLTG